MSVVETLNKRKHVMEYDSNIIPTEDDIEDIIRSAYFVVPSRFNAYPYTVHVLGPNAERSLTLWELSMEQNSLTSDVINPTLSHIKSAPYTLIITPRVTSPNKYYHGQYRGWEENQWSTINKDNRENSAVEIGLFSLTLTSVLLEKGWDTSYSICFPRTLTGYLEFPFIKQVPSLIQTIGKGRIYRYETMTTEELETDTKAPIEDVVLYHNTVSK